MKLIKYTVCAFLAISLTGCKKESSQQDHASDHGHDHSHQHEAHGHEHHSHDHGSIEARPAGPNGGRVLETVEPHLEFFVLEDRKVQLTALTDELTASVLGDQIVSLMAGDRANPTRMLFSKVDDQLVSDVAFPDGDDFPVVISIRANDEAQPIVEKFTMDFSPCPSCKYLEYACTCDHGNSQGHGHDH